MNGMCPGHPCDAVNQAFNCQKQGRQLHQSKWSGSANMLKALPGCTEVAGVNKRPGAAKKVRKRAREYSAYELV